MNEMDLKQQVHKAVTAALATPDFSTEDGMHVPPVMTLALAKKLIARVEQKAAEMGVKAVIAVSNAGGHPVAVVCMDDSYIASYDVAVSKSFTGVALKMSTAELKQFAQPGGALYGIQYTNDHKIIIFGGGVPLMVNNCVIGGLGVSGGTEEQDTALAEFGRGIFAEELS